MRFRAPPRRPVWWRARRPPPRAEPRPSRASTSSNSRKENADRRKRAEELEGRNAKLVAELLRAEVVADGRLADPADLLDGADTTTLLDDDGAPDPEKVKTAVTELLTRKPHYAKRISGDVGQGARPGPADPNEELWGIIQSRTR
jgi:hypothetical protein